MAEEPIERFKPTSGRITAALGLVLAAVVVVSGIIDHDAGFPLWVTLGAVVVAVLIWAAMLRPRVAVSEHELVLRNMLETVSLPLAAIEEIAVRQVLAVRVGEKRYVSPAVGRSWRAIVKSNRAPRKGASQTVAAVAATSYPDFVEERIRQKMDDARAKLGIQRYSEAQVALAERVRREPAWLEIGALGVSFVAFVGAIFFG